MSLNDDTKYVLAWCIPISIVIICLIISLSIVTYFSNVKFIENGYEHTTLPGDEGVAWQRVK